MLDVGWIGVKDPYPESRVLTTPGRGCYPDERVKTEIRISKSETNLKFECSNALNNKITGADCK